MGQFRSSAGTMGKGSVETRSGPRIFVGKLNKETTENDVKVQTPQSCIISVMSPLVKDLLLLLGA